MIDARRLLSDLQRVVRDLESDLRARVAGEPDVRRAWETEFEAARASERTGLAFEVWCDQRVTQVAVGWVLACVFTRFCEDNGLLDDVWLSGPGERLAEARDRQLHYGREHLGSSDLDYLVAALDRLAAVPVTAALVDTHNPRTLLAPTPDAATRLLEFWRRIDPASGRLAHDFTDRSLQTRFLGDLYQDLSEQARKDYALLQTPEFVAEFILDRTLDLAIEEFGLATVRLIDPACGSGHFLLGAFARLLSRWQELEPGTDVQLLVGRVLDQVAGVDINPYAAAIARFRLVVAAIRACGIRRLVDAPAWRLHVAVGDSLLFGASRRQRGRAGDSGEGRFVYSYEDAAELDDVLGRRYHAVVANPPYITVKDPVLNRAYREGWNACAGQYAMSVPFVQHIFDLAVEGGFTGQITANSFMKREFGRKLIEQFLASLDLSLVVDTSGAYIPGHGTPTVLLFGRNRGPVHKTVRAVLGIRGEPSAPIDARKGFVWTDIVHNVDLAGRETEYVSVHDRPRTVFRSFPWSLAGGGSSDLFSRITNKRTRRLGPTVDLVGGRTAHTGSDESYFAPPGTWHRHEMDSKYVKPLVEGEVVRDWRLSIETETLFPYSGALRAHADYKVASLLWLTKPFLVRRREPGGTHEEIGLTWYEFSRFHPDRFLRPHSIAMAFVATHNHFVFDRGGKVFNRSAPVIKLPVGASKEEHLRLLGVLNSSTACFWLKQVSHNKGSSVDHRGARQTTVEWENFYEFTGTKLADFPLPDGAPLELATRLDGLAQELGTVTPAAVCEDVVPTRQRLDAARQRSTAIRAEMVSAQEELDWEVYDLYGLLGDDADALIGKDVTKPPVQLGERAFEIALARKMAAGEVETQWFSRHRSRPITELPEHWPPDYRALVERRLEFTAADPYLHLIERPECKRRWQTEPWEKQESEALENWLLDRLEDRRLWFIGDGFPRLRTVAQLADEVRTDPDFTDVAALYARDVDLTAVVTVLVKDQHVPFLAASRYTDTGMDKRQVWERTWELQRREDAGEHVGTIAVPPKYKQADFRAGSYWRLRGKLDVPKERFTSYPDASRDGTLLLGWAGFDHLQRAQALAAYVGERIELDGWGADRLAPLLAGLAELLPWVRQWHDEPDPTFGQRPADAYQGALDGWLHALDLTPDDLARWRPPTPTRGRRSRAEPRGR